MSRTIRSQGQEATDVIIPDEALEYITRHYLEKHSTEGVPAVLGISSTTVEHVLGLFIEWAGAHGYVRNGVLMIGGHKIG